MYNLDNFAVRAAVKGVIIKDGKFLILHRHDYDSWDLPGGKVEKNESPKDALVREIEEETRLKVNVKEACGVFLFIGTVSKKQYVLTNIACEYVDGEVQLSDEHDSYKWISQEEINKYNILNEQARNELVSYFKSLKNNK